MLKIKRTHLSFHLAALFLLGGCGDDSDASLQASAKAFVLSSVVIDADGNRTTYVQTIPSLDAGPFTNDRAIEAPGNGVVLGGGRHFFIGLAEEPTWIRYSLDDSGAIVESGRLSFLNLGATRIDFGNALVDDNTAVSVLSAQATAVVWDPTRMEILGEIDLSHMVRDGFSLEVWTTTAYNGLAFIPARWSDWQGSRIGLGVQTTIVDPVAMRVVGVAEDDRCASGGRVVFDDQGFAYVMGDGRNYSIHMFANASGGSAPDNCLLRIRPGSTDFEESYFYTIPSLTGGLQSITELETAVQGSSLGFAKMFYPDELPAGVEPIDFDFWGSPAHKMWRIQLSDPPTAEEVEGIPFSTIGFAGSPFEGRLYTGESPDGNTTEVYEVDPVSNTARLRFTMDGYFNGLYELTR